MVALVHTWRWLFFALFAVAIGTVDLPRAEDIAAQRYATMTRADWGVTNIWISASECARQTGAWLVTCDGAKLLPIAHAAAADDPGHALFLALMAIVLDRPMAVVDVARLNIAINFTAMLALATLLFAARSYIAAIVVMLLGGDVFLSWIGISPHPPMIGTAGFAAILPATIVLTVRGYLSVAASVALLAIGALLLGAATLLREPVGNMGMVISAGALVWLGWRATARTICRQLCPMAMLTLVAWQTPLWTLLARDIAFSIPSTEQVETHGTSHNLYLGLGAIENKFGITWSDAAGAEAVARVKANVPYTSKEYFRILWKIYFDKAREDPLEIVRIYWTKGLAMLNHRLPERWYSLWLVLGVTFGAMIAGYRLRVWQLMAYEQAPLLLGVGLAFVGFFILQGILAHHSIGYAHPIGAFVLLFAAVAVEAIVRGSAVVLRYGLRPAN